MGIINDLGLNEIMTKEQISEQLFNVRKKLITRQNSADAQKRTAAELQLDVLSSLQNSIDKMTSDFPDVQIIIGTYGYSADNGKLNKDLKEAIESAVAGDGNSAGNIADFLGNNGQEQLRNEWMFWAANCGAAQAYQICGYLLTDTNPDEALKWFEKANQANAIGASNIYNWGLILYRRKEYANAKEKFERASAEGHAMAPYFIGEMYENGYGVTKDLKKALEQYQLAKQRGLQEAQQGITRVATVLNQQSTTNSATNQQNNSTPRSHQINNPQNGQPTLVYKSDRKSAIPNLEDINIDNLKDKVKVDEIAGKVGDFANGVAEKVDLEKIKKLPWKKIAIGAVVVVVLLLVLKSCGSGKNVSIPNGNANKQENVETTTNNDSSEMAASENSESQLSDEEKAIVGTYSGYYCVGSGKRGLTLDIYEKNGLEASFSFYPLNNGDNFSAGEYLMDVKYNGGKYEFTATDWVNQPGGYYSLDLSGVLDKDMVYGVTGENYPFSVAKVNDGYVANTWLTDLMPIYKDDDVYIEAEKVGTANTSDSYMHYMFSRKPYSEVMYQLNGQYKYLSALWAICYNDRDDEGTHAFDVFADDRLVYSSDVIQAGTLPISIDIDINYCNVLRIRFKQGGGEAELANVLLSNSDLVEKKSDVQKIEILPCWLTDLDYLTSNNVTVRANDKGVSNIGEEYSHYIFGREGASIEYYLRGQYNNLSATWAVCYNDRDISYASRFEIYADDELVYSSPSITGGDMPVDVNVDIKNCQKLRFVFPEGNGAAELSNIYLMNVE